ncbi:inactive homolog of metal-dependent proteases [Striga asiatica]|uniref:Inactive homolog of metal-dependent proteases n=1 Tax=Striga asiatica TaxID=4170 RepID=A0A5A7R0F5_STRAF|nr:inactive homolog of metal-dependent proteases [Striga asiatica]
MHRVGALGPLRVDHGRRRVLPHVIYIHKPAAAAGGGEIHVEILVNGVIAAVWEVRRRWLVVGVYRRADLAVKMQGLRIGSILVLRMEVEMRTGDGVGIGVGVEVVLDFLRRRTGRMRVPLSLGRQIENRGGRTACGAVEILGEKAIEGEPDGLEGLEIGDVGLGEGETLSYGLVEKRAALAAQGHRRRVFELRAGAAHQEINGFEVSCREDGLIAH